MTIKQLSPRKKTLRVVWVLVGILTLGIFLVNGGFTFAAS
jgi:LPS O-antigen subunit length determinant protein (WzzB/FepE family)